MESFEEPIQPVPSPYAGKRLSVSEHLTIASFWFASNFMWGSFLAVVLAKQLETISPAGKAQALGLLSGIAAIVPLIVPLITGALSDRCTHRWGRRKPFIVAGGAVNVVGLALMYFAGDVKSFWLYLAAYCVVQLGNNIATAPYSGMIPDLVPEEQRGVASGYMALMTQLGTLLGAVITGQLMGRGMTAATYFVIGAVLTGCVLLTALKVKENPLTVKPPKLNWVEYLKSLWIDPRKYPDFAWVWITRAFVMMGFYSIQPFAQYYLGDVIGVENPAQTVGIFIAIILAGAAASGMYGGSLSDKIGRKQVVYIANTFMAVMAVGLIFCRTMPQVLFVGVLFGLGYGAYISVDWALGTDVLPSKTSAAKDMAVWHVSMVFPQAISQPLAGYLLGQFIRERSIDPKTHEMVTHYSNAGYGVLFGMAAVFFAMGAYFLKNVKKAR